MKRLALAAALAAVVLFAPPTVSAADPSAIDCDAYVVDQAGVLAGDMKAQADAAVLRLQNVGADPRVVFVDNLGRAGSIDAFERHLVRRCSSWQSADGLRKNNLVAVIVAMSERKAVISWGERWNPSLEGQADRIRSDFLNPNLADGHFGLAVKETLGEIGGLLAHQLHPGSTTANRKGGSANLWPLWIILIALVGIGLVIGAFFALKALAKARREREEAQRRALAARNAAADAVLAMTQAHDDLQTAVEIAKGSLGTEEADDLATSVGRASQLVGTTGESYSTLGTAASDPEKGHRTGEYEHIAAGYKDVVGQAEAAQQAVSDAAQLADRLVELTKAVPGELERSKQALAHAREALAAVSEEGYRVGDYAKRLDEADTHQAGAARHVEGRRAQKASADIEAADDLIEKAVQGAERLPARKAQLEADAEALQPRIKQTEEAIEAAKPVFAEISSTYAEDSWRPVAGNGSQAERAVAYAVEALAHARRSSTMETQRWDEAQAALDEAAKGLDQAKALTAALVGLKPALEQAKASAQPELDAAEADIATAAEYERSYDADIRDEIKDDIRSAQGTLAQAQAQGEMRREKPNFLLVVKLAQQANSSADRVLLECQSEHVQMERLRRQATSAIGSAESEIARAESYISTNALVAGQSARSSLDSARSNLDLARAAPDPQNQISYAQAAESDAERAYSEAQAHVDEMRAPSRWEQGAAFVLSSSGSSRDSFSSSFSSGGFGGGGSSGGFGGGGGGSSSGGW